MSHVVDDVDRSVRCSGDATQEPAANKAIDSNEASNGGEDSRPLRNKLENTLQRANQLH